MNLLSLSQKRNSFTKLKIFEKPKIFLYLPLSSSLYELQAEYILEFTAACRIFKWVTFCEALPRKVLKNTCFWKKGTFCQIFKGIASDYRTIISFALLPGKTYFLLFNCKENQFFEKKPGSTA